MPDPSLESLQSFDVVEFSNASDSSSTSAPSSSTLTPSLDTSPFGDGLAFDIHRRPTVGTFPEQPEDDDAETENTPASTSTRIHQGKGKGVSCKVLPDARYPNINMSINSLPPYFVCWIAEYMESNHTKFQLSRVTISLFRPVPRDLFFCEINIWDYACITQRKIASDFVTDEGIGFYLFFDFYELTRLFNPGLFLEGSRCGNGWFTGLPFLVKQLEVRR